MLILVFIVLSDARLTLTFTFTFLEGDFLGISDSSRSASAVDEALRILRDSSMLRKFEDDRTRWTN